MSYPTLLTVLISYNRPGLLDRTLTSYLNTVTLPHTLVVVDNGSDQETLDYLYAHSGYTLMPLGENRYPGYATNFGWGMNAGGHQLLHRSDNDVEYLPGWCEEIIRMLETHHEVGQLGLRTLEEEGPHAAVGGNCVIRRELFDAGVRYRDEPWGAVVHEDGYLAQEVTASGWAWARAERPCIVHLGEADMDDAYYQESFRVRGLA